MSKIFIDCFNLSTGGGVTHLVSVLREKNPNAIVFCSSHLARLLSNLKLSNLEIYTHWMLNRGLVFRLIWHVFISKRCFKRSSSDIAFYPGGICFSGVRPYVTMSRNLLPFTLREVFRLKSFRMRVKLIMVRFAQIRTFSRAQGVIFLNVFAHMRLKKYVPDDIKISLISHGNNTFSRDANIKDAANLSKVRNQRSILYVSHFTSYKNHMNLLRAFAEVSKRFDGLTLDLVGALDESYPECARFITDSDFGHNKVVVHGELPASKLGVMYGSCDYFIFASSCENYPNIINEVASYRPVILSSLFSPMPALLHGEAYYFNPLDSSDISRALKYVLDEKSSCLVEKPQRASNRFNNIEKIGWEECSERTFSFIEDCVLI